jgi:hypothetical protein
VIHPERDGLQPSPLVFPPCTESCQPGKGTKRFRGKGEKPSPSTAAPPKPATPSPGAALAQQLLRNGLSESKTYILVRYKPRRGGCTSSFGNGVSAYMQMRPFRYMPGANIKKASDVYGRPMVVLDSMLTPPGPRAMLLFGVRDCLVVNEQQAMQCAVDGSWFDPRTSEHHAALGPGSALTTRPTDPTDPTDPTATTDADGEEEYEVEAIVDEVRVDDHEPTGSFLYLVQWAGWGSEENQWMTRDELTNCNHVLQSWLNKARRPIFSLQTQPTVFSNLKVNDHLQVYDDDASRWVQCVVKQVHSKTVRLVDMDGDHFTACRQTWLRSGPAIDRDTTKKREWRALQPVVPSKSARVDAKASGLKGADTEWLDDLDINRVQQHLDRSCYYRSQFPVSDYYPMPVDLHVQALQRFVRGERSTKIAQVFRNGKCGCWVMNLHGSHWVVLFLDGRHKRGYYIDSLGKACPRSLVSALDGANKVCHELDDQESWVFYTTGRMGQTNAGATLQADGYQCGIWALTVEQWVLQFVAMGGDHFDWWMRKLKPVCDRAPARASFIAGQRDYFRSLLLDESRAQLSCDQATLQSCLKDNGLDVKLARRQGDSKSFAIVV